MEKKNLLYESLIFGTLIKCLFKFANTTKEYLYIPVENHTKFQLKTIPLINAYLPSFFTNERRI
ncbi:MAG: hypothetical protein ACQERS_08720, partial [Bacteroidota bacterium]